MPLQGVQGRVEIFSAFSPALEGIGSNSHLILLGWMHRGERDLLQARARKVAEDLPVKGVFALRSPSRPNPISISVVQLFRRSGERFLDVGYLDLVDGTPVLDIKPYQPGWDSVFSATTHDRSEKIYRMGDVRYRQTLMREAVSYHGEWCSGAATAVRLAERATPLFGDLRKAHLWLHPEANPCIADALIGITGARPGNGRLSFTLNVSSGLKGHRVIIGLPGEALEFSLLCLAAGPDEILEAKEEDIFTVRHKGRGR
jgi:tRNA-Thr(GGU) m(6)t(6)A37 methyltransferase TsaA